MPSTSTAVRASGARRSSSRRPGRRTSAGGSRRRSARRAAPRNAGNWWSVALVALAVLGAIVWSRDDGPASAEPSCALPGSAVTISPEQAGNAAVIASVAWDRGLPDRAVVIALATAQQESGLRNLDYGDRDSLGLFQQRPSRGWGTEAQVTDPPYAAGIFFDRLVEVPGWDTGRLTDVAQTVQRSGFPEAYQKHEAMAVDLTAALRAGGGELDCR
ncbi:MAG: hypothetical protein ACLGI3_00715 [Actinomycetes bacterium]